MMGFDAESFDRILVKFGPMFSGHTPFHPSGMIVEFEYTRGRKREVQPEDCLGLVLVWTRTRGSLNVLQLVFGLTYSNLCVYLRFGIRLIIETFRNDPLARVSIPSGEEIAGSLEIKNFGYLLFFVNHFLSVVPPKKIISNF